MTDVHVFPASGPTMSPIIYTDTYFGVDKDGDLSILATSDGLARDADPIIAVWARGMWQRVEQSKR